MIVFPDRPSVMGILNVTPDSFSDGGLFFNPSDAVARVKQMIEEGADIVDVGGESTRPGAAPVTEEEELRRVIPVIQAIREFTDIPISIDTSRAVVMLQAAEAGASLINDVRALQREGSIQAARQTGLPVCLMHMQGDPETMQANPTYEDVVEEVKRFFEARISACEAAGIPKQQLILDPGFGFGKTVEHNLRLINRLETFNDLGCPLLVGLSRKSTIARVAGGNPLIGSVVGAVWAYERGAKILRVHDVAETYRGLKMARAFMNEAND